MNDKLVYDLSLETEGVPNVFIRKDWVSILDNQNGNYQGNQSVIDTSQISNSNKFMNYREGYLAIPLLMSVEYIPVGAAINAVKIGDGAIGLKNWFGNMIHSFTLDYNGSTVIQQTNFINMFNSFKLLTSLSYADILLHGSTIGFYPDTPDSWTVEELAVLNNSLLNGITYEDCVQTQLGVNQLTYGGNDGLTKRILNINFEPDDDNGYTDIINDGNLTSMWLSQLTRSAANVAPFLQVSVMAIVYLKHLSSFFNFVPLLKGAFMKFTMNFNTASTQIQYDVATGIAEAFDITIPSGGIMPLQIPDGVLTGNRWIQGVGGAAASRTVHYNVSVGDTCLNNIMVQSVAGKGKVAKNIFLYVPAYSFNPSFYESYISSSPKRVVYTDVYQYIVPSVLGQSNFNVNVSNGIPNIKSVLVIPFLKRDGVEQYKTPFDGAGAGATAPLTFIKNFQVQISGQNTIYNNQQYTFEEFNNQLMGCNGVNGGLTDGLTSGLIDFNAFKNSYCYYYVNVERMLPSEKNVPKNVQLFGQIQSRITLEYSLMVFVEYENSMKFDLLTGARLN